MIGVDTNVLVRLLTGDDATQSATAQTFLEQNCSSDEPGYVNVIVLVETVWVLDSIYQYERSDIVAAIDGLLRTIVIHIEEAELVRFALIAYRDGADFSDALIAQKNVAAHCTKTITFDRKAAKKVAHFAVI